MRQERNIWTVGEIPKEKKKKQRLRTKQKSIKITEIQKKKSPEHGCADGTGDFNWCMPLQQEVAGGTVISKYILLKNLISFFSFKI